MRDLEVLREDGKLYLTKSGVTLSLMMSGFSLSQNNEQLNRNVINASKYGRDIELVYSEYTTDELDEIIGSIV